jgi:hypothetical protein
MRADAEESLARWEHYHAECERKHRRFGLAIVLTAVFLLCIGVAVAK